LTEEAGAGLHFLLPGGTPLAAQLQLARAICRRAERRLWTLHREDPLPEEILKYVNRLSDLFFVMARHELDQQDWPEERWQAFAYKNQQ
jgi:ATP:cob(I)alamin adenosyltransferase